MARVALPGVVGLDTNCFIYFFDDAASSPRATYLARQVFEPLSHGRRRAVTSTVTLAELLTRPYGDGEPGRAGELRTAIEGMPNLTVVPVDGDVADHAARVRAATSLRLPDAVQVASALAGGAEALVTNDRSLTRAGSLIDVLVLDELTGRSR